MTKYEVKEMLSQYRKECSNVECLKKRLSMLKAITVVTDDVKSRIEEVNALYDKAVLKTDSALAKALEMIGLLSNNDGDADVLRKYHIEGLSERAIAKQFYLSVDYIRTKRWRAYQKISKEM